MVSVKLKDIAQETGVSISTVSRILNKGTSKKTSSKTAEKILESAQKLGFFSQPNMYKHAIVNSDKKVYSIGCILTSQHETFVSPFFSSLLAAIQNELAKISGQLQYNFFVTNIRDPGFSRFLVVDKLDCAIMLGRTTMDNITMLKNTIPNLVYAGVNKIGADIDEVICDGYEGVKHAINYCVSLGHKDIGYIGPTQATFYVANEHRYTAFVDTIKEAGLQLRQNFIKDTILTSAAGYDSATEMIKHGSLPTAIFCANDSVALGVMRAFDDNNISIPDDISIIGFDNIDMAAYVKPALTTISIPTMELGRLAVKMLLDKIETSRKYPIKLNIPFEFVVRESCKKIG